MVAVRMIFGGELEKRQRCLEDLEIYTKNRTRAIVLDTNLTLYERLMLSVLVDNAECWTVRKKCVKNFNSRDGLVKKITRVNKRDKHMNTDRLRQKETAGKNSAQ